MSMTLYEISDTYRQFMEAVEAEEIPEEAIGDTLESIEGLFTDKADAIACIIKNCQAEAKAIQKEAAALTERARRKAATADRLTEYLLGNMIALDKLEIETVRNKLQVKKNPASVVITNEAELYALRPDLFTTKAPEPSKTLIGAVLKAGETLPGCELQSGYRLAVK